jgi:CRP-like cAMP-binding protein/membrane protease YdiL (CAAX protease family)
MMDKKKIFSLLKDSSIFIGLSDEQLELLISFSEVKTVAKSEYILHEGDHGHELYLILTGQVEILKHDEATGYEHLVSVIDAIGLIGEMALVDQSTRSASARATEETELLVIPYDKLSSLAQKNDTFTHISLNISKQISHRLRRTDEVTVKSLKAELEWTKVRLEMGRFFFGMLIVLSGWVFIISALKEYDVQIKTTAMVSFPLLLVLMSLCINYVGKSIYPLSFFGLTSEKWKKDCFEGIFFSLPFIVLATFGKWVLINWVPAFQHDQLFGTNYLVANKVLTPTVSLMLSLGYLGLVPAQEFIARGFLQSMLTASFSGASHIFWSIILSNLVFSAFHAELSILYATMAFLVGCFWGWLRNRQGSLVGSITSHIFIGAWCLILLDLGRVLTTY